MNSDPQSRRPGNIVFFSISKDQDLVHSYNGGGEDLRALAHDWIRNAKRYHVWHSHTEANKTFGFLMRDGLTFFAINDDAGGGAGNARVLSFLERLRDEYKNAPRKDKIDGEVLNWVLRVSSSDTSRNGSKDDGALKIEAFGGVISLSQSLSLRLMAQKRARKLWWRQLKIVAAVDGAETSLMAAVDDLNHLVHVSFGSAPPPKRLFFLVDIDSNRDETFNQNQLLEFDLL